jgi:hypothetical protein
MQSDSSLISLRYASLRYSDNLALFYEACSESKFRLAVNGYEDNILNISLFVQVYMLLDTS